MRKNKGSALVPGTENSPAGLYLKMAPVQDASKSFACV
jgi:hypothetical protein